MIREENFNNSDVPTLVNSETQAQEISEESQMSFLRFMRVQDPVEKIDYQYFCNPESSEQQ